MKTETKQLKTRWYYIKWIIEKYRGHGKLVAFMLVLSGLATTTALLLPLLLKSIIDGMTSGLKAFAAGKVSLEIVMADRNRGLWLLLALGIGPIIGAVYPWLRFRMNLWFEKTFRRHFFRETLAQNSEFFMRYRTGDLVTRISENLKTNTTGLPWLCCSGIFRAVTSTGIIVCCVLGLFAIHKWLALAALVPMPFMLYVFLQLETTMEKRCESVQEKISETVAYLESAFTGIRILKSFTAERSRQNSFRDLLKERQKEELAQASIDGLFHVYFEFLSYLGELLVLIYGGVLVVKGELTIGSFYAFFSYLGMILPALMDVPMLLATLTQGYAIIDRLEELENKTSNQNPGVPLSGKFAGLCFDGVNFAYPISADEKEGMSRPKGFAMRNMSFAVSPGEKVAIMGPIGSGKTTLLLLAAGLYQSTGGEITVNDQPLGVLDERAWRQRIGFVQQEATIFSGSVWENIDFWRDYDREKVVYGAELAQIHNEIERLPQKYDELLGVRGLGLSGGQKQRLSLARALAGDPELLLMDDVTAGLDAENEKKLWRRLKRAAPDLTCLVVTHRIATAKVADRVIVLDRGRIVASGKHHELLQTSSLYRDLAGFRGMVPQTLAA